MCPQLISYNQKGHENLEALNLLWSYSGKGLIFSHVREQTEWETVGEFRENAVCMQEKIIGHGN